MFSVADVLDQAVASLDRVIKKLKRGTTKQVSASEDRTSLKSTALTWFKSYRSALQVLDSNSVLKVMMGGQADLFDLLGRRSSLGNLKRSFFTYHFGKGSRERVRLL